MNQLKHLMVCLDLTEMDELLIQYTAYFCSIVKGIEKVYFVHNIRFDNSDDAQRLISKLEKPLGEIVVEIIEEKIQQSFQDSPSPVDHEIIVEEASSTPAVMAQIVQSHKIQLTIIGKKITYRGSGLVAEKLLRFPHFHSSLLLLPETAYHRIQKILVPTDFSKPSIKAIEVGLRLQQMVKANFSCQHVFNIPSFYFPSMMVEDSEPALRKEAEKRWLKFAKALPSNQGADIECALSFNCDKNIAQTIYDHALKTNTDLIIMGAKGKGGIAAFLVGSVAMQLVQADLHIPLWLVSRKEKNKF